ncbi:FAM32A-like-like protein [Drosera capensis]
MRDVGMSAYDNVVVGKLKLKGKALDVKSGGVKKKKHKKKYDGISQVKDSQKLEGGSADISTDPNEEFETLTKEGRAPHIDDHLTPAEKRYIEQRQELDVQWLAKKANKSHRDRIEQFNQSLANMSEHYDIPKVGPG